ncbi:MAG: hypothetical protein ACRCYA_00315 [Cetobacterium sp.]|uniref:hypothetical protein n=1 Tax=Cetobacterium sp. TaxID=2071632 RepID=UPI003F38866D
MRKISEVERLKKELNNICKKKFRKNMKWHFFTEALTKQGINPFKIEGKYKRECKSWKKEFLEQNTFTRIMFLSEEIRKFDKSFDYRKIDTNYYGKKEKEFLNQDKGVIA